MDTKKLNALIAADAGRRAELVSYVIKGLAKANALSVSDAVYKTARTMIVDGRKALGCDDGAARTYFSRLMTECIAADARLAAMRPKREKVVKAKAEAPEAPEAPEAALPPIEEAFKLAENLAAFMAKHETDMAASWIKAARELAARIGKARE